MLMVLWGMLSAFAREIAPIEALQNALTFLEADAQASEMLLSDVNAVLRLVHTQKNNTRSLFYVYAADQGFLITAADSHANAVLGYTDCGTYDEALKNPAFRAWLESCTGALTYIANQPESAFQEASPEIPATRAGLPETVSPLLESIAWNQGTPYNNLCPVASGTKCAAGCVATAMAMVMKYWEWPLQGTGQVSYTTRSYSFELSADFSQSSYDWHTMLNRYDGQYTEEQATAVAKLMKDVGISVEMNYGPSSGTSSKMVPWALANYFSYNKGMKFLQRCFYSSAEWNRILKTEMAESRPVLMSGINYTEMVGHEFVLDGYNAQGLYHVNWGWGGTSNGYFDVNFMSPQYQGIGGSNGGYVAEQSILADLYPDEAGTSAFTYNLFARRGLQCNSRNEITMLLENCSLIPFTGEAGIIAEKNGAVIANVMDSFSEQEVAAMDQQGLIYKLEELGLSASQIGEGGTCYVYPAFKTANGAFVKLLSPVYESSRLVITSKGGTLSISADESDAAHLSQVSLALDGLAFSGYPMYFKVQVKNEAGAAEFNNLLGVEVTNSKGTSTYGKGFDCQIIPGGSSSEFYIKVDAGKLAIGSYRAYLIYGYYNDYERVGTKYTTIVVNQAPAAAKLTYSNPTFFANRVEEGAPVDITMNVTNNGGYTEHEFAAYLFPTGGDGYSVGVLGPVSCRITAIKMNQIKISGIMDLEPGSYFCIVRDNTTGAWVPNSNIRHTFAVTASVTGIKGLTPASSPERGDVYDLSGRKVQNTGKGVLIKNGKKVVKK